MSRRSDRALSIQAERERNQRERLFSENKPRKASTTASEAQSIQKSLNRTQDLLKNELHRVNQVAAVIEEDGKVLQQTKDHHDSLSTKKAKKALAALERARREEQRVLLASIIFFCFVCFYVMWSRVLIKFDIFMLFH